VKELDPLNVVTLREYVDRIFSENQRAVEAALKNQEFALDRARSHIEAIFAEHRRAHDQKHVDDEKAQEQARRAIDLRLEKLNELRSEVIQDRGEYLRRDVFDSQLQGVLKQISELADFRSRALGLAVVLSLISGAIGAVIGRLLG